jgi:hypothetical protein
MVALIASNIIAYSDVVMGFVMNLTDIVKTKLS